MLENEIKKLTAAITRLADLMEAGNAPGENREAPVVDAPEEPVAVAPVVDTAALRLQAQDLCLVAVRADRLNKAVIADWLGALGAKMIKDLDDNRLPAFIAYLEGLTK